jgi:hypothetical protein
MNLVLRILQSDVPWYEPWNPNDFINQVATFLISQFPLWFIPIFFIFILLIVIKRVWKS